MSDPIITTDEQLPAESQQKLLPEVLEIKVGRIEINVDGVSHGYLKVDGEIIKKVTGFVIEAFAGEQPVVTISLTP